MTLITVISTIFLIIFLVPLGYLYLLALASIKMPPPVDSKPEELTHRFVIAIPAHNEANVIEATVTKILKMSYPKHLYSVHIVADYCSDNTATLARQAGAVVHERHSGSRSGKGAALSYLFKRILNNGKVDAVVIFDADTQVDVDFLKIMDAQLTQGQKVIQGNHIIRNPDDGWFPALTWAMFMVDNRFQNQGRSNLGWSAKHMGDSICFRSDILAEMGWGDGLTEDYHLRQKLLLAGYRIKYEPRAKGYGEAPLTWTQARTQRARWLRGTHDASKELRNQLLAQAIKLRKGALIDGALQAFSPSYSTLTMLSGVFLLATILANYVYQPMPDGIVWAWFGILVFLFFYPLFGLYLERAPFKAYLVMLSGPFYVFWRTWLAWTGRLGKKGITWIRTAHGERK